MASNIKAPPEKNMRGAPETRAMPFPLLDLTDAAVTELIRSAKRRGYVTIDKNIPSILGEMGVNMVETNEAEPEEEVATREEPEEEAEGENELVEVQQRPPAKFGATKPAQRTDDPVRMYLREMGSMELVSREGEIAIAKRIEAGREAMIAGLCESPLTFQAIVIWRDKLNEERSSCATSSTSSNICRPCLQSDTGAGDSPPRPVHCGHRRPGQARAFAADAGARDCARDRHPLKAAGEHTVGEETTADGTMSECNLDDDDMENWLSVTAIEAELKPKVIETLDTVAGPTSGCVGCRTRTSSCSSKGCRSRPRKNASTRS